jgi:hypothetical protein
MGRTELMFMSHHQNAGKDYKLIDKSFENVAKFKYLEMTVTNQNYLFLSGCILLCIQ